MAEYTALAPLFTDIANAIRSKTGETGAITANNFPQEINNISSDEANKTLIYSNTNFYLRSSDDHGAFNTNVLGESLIGKRWLIIELSSTTGDTTVNTPFGLRVGAFSILNDMNGLSGNVNSPLTFYVPIRSFRCINKQSQQFAVYSDLAASLRLNEPNYPTSLLKMDIYSGTSNTSGPYSLKIYIE